MQWKEGSSPRLGHWRRRKAVRFGDPGTCGWRELSQHRALHRRAEGLTRRRTEEWTALGRQGHSTTSTSCSLACFGQGLTKCGDGAQAQGRSCKPQVRAQRKARRWTASLTRLCWDLSENLLQPESLRLSNLGFNPLQSSGFP